MVGGRACWDSSSSSSVMGEGASRVGGAKAETGGEPKSISSKGRDICQRLVRNSVIGKTDALREGGPIEIVGRRQKLHCPIPVTPPTFDFSVALGIVHAGGGAGRPGVSRDGREQFGKEFGSSVRVNDVGRTPTKENLVQESRYEGGGFAVREGQHEHSLREAIYDS